ncbi:MAG: chemotaxis protein CheA [Acidobacteria bacterium]|nr:chemotaxis protein CheA [Acidobacteriota bacterium]
MSNQANRGLEALLNDQAVRLMMPGPDVEAEGWQEFLGDLKQLAEAQGRADVSRLASEYLAEGEASLPDMQQQLVRLQKACEGRPAPPAALSQDPELVRDFIMESREHLQNIERSMLAIENDPNDVESIHGTFRAFHTIKGLAGFLEFAVIQEVAHEVETLLDMARNHQIELTGATVDVILASADHLNQQLNPLEKTLLGEPAPDAPEPHELLSQIRSILRGDNPAAAVEPAVEAEPESTTAEPMVTDTAVPAITLPAAPELAFPMADEPVAALPPVAKPAAPVSATTPAAPPAPPKPTAPVEIRAAETKPEAKAPAVTKAPAANAAPNASGGSMSSVKVDTGKLDYLVDMVGELVIAQSLVRHNPDLVALKNPSLMRTISQLGRITDEVQKTAMSMRMVPLETLFQKMIRLVRDLSRKAGKQIEMDIAGEDTELDRNIVEALADPLMHMVRNSIDHGIETSTQRAATDKPPVAKVKLHAAHQAGYIMITVGDDGRGMDRRKILAKARERGLVENGDNLSDNDVFNLIFEPGFSTAEQVTDISGRGVGMDVVKRQIQKLRGRIEIVSVLGKGTEFTLKVPLTLAIIDGLIVGVGEERYIVPIFAIKEMLRPTAEMISTVEGRAEIALIRGRVLPVVRLYRRFGVEPKSQDPEQSLIIIAEARGRDFCLVVDDLIGKQEVVIKSLGDGIRPVPGIAGGAILGDGRVGLILDMNGVFSADQGTYDGANRAA